VQAAPRNDLDADYTPRYIWLAKLLRGWIEDGTYSPGSLLPSSARLAAVHSVSRATALHALAVLTKSGHVRHVDSKPHQVIWRLSTAATMPASCPGSAGGPQSPLVLCPSQNLQHGGKALDQRGEQCLSLLCGSQRGSAYHSAGRIFTHPGGEDMTPVIRYPVRRMVAIAD
jgi:DNA-binding transcriptional MocR family regulator